MKFQPVAGNTLCSFHGDHLVNVFKDEVL